MVRKHRFKVDKLIRDKAPDIATSKGIEIFNRVMGQEEYLKRLKGKLLEETKEVLEAKTPKEAVEELADLLEVMRSLSEALGFSFEEIEAAREQKREEQGGFEERIFGICIEISSDNPHIGPFLGRPEKYPEVNIEGA